MTDDIGSIQHPVVREVLRIFAIEDRLDISIMSDLPATGSGLGSSSAFTVGFLNLAYSLTGRACTKIDLARKAIHVERDVLHENVGVQDQLHATFGGMNRFDFKGGRISITPLDALVNRRLNKRRQMRWSPRGAERTPSQGRISWTDVCAMDV